MHAKHFLSISGLVLAALLTAPRSAAAVGLCSFDSTVGVNFGAYDVFNTIPTDSTGSLTYSCTSVLGTITIDLSRGSAPSYVPRQMRKGAETLSYNLYLDAARVSIWGDGTGGTSHYGPVVPALASPVTVTIYGRIPARENVSVGSYTDTITATINF
jgi:spore coat protein U-like protein